MDHFVVGSRTSREWVLRSKPGCSYIPTRPSGRRNSRITWRLGKTRYGEEFKLAPLYKINAPRMIMSGQAKEYFDLWEADHYPANAAKTYEELLNKVKDYARRGKFILLPRRKSNKEETPWM